MPIPSLDSWKVESLRLTCFSTEFIHPDTLRGAWKMIADEEPETEGTNRQAGTYTESGQLFEGAQLDMRTEFNRVDWVLYPANTVIVEDILNIGSLDCLSPFFGKLTSWLSNAHFDINRLAVGVVGLHQVPSREVCYEELTELLPFLTLDPATSREFMLQINMPIGSNALEGTEMNRMARFSAARFKMLVGDLQSLRPTPELFATRVELDMNSSAERAQLIEKAELLALKDELVAAAMDVFTKGYVR